MNKTILLLKLEEFLSGKISRMDFERWLAPYSWEIEKIAEDKEVIDLVHQIDLIFYESHIELNSELQKILTNHR